MTKPVTAMILVAALFCHGCKTATTDYSTIQHGRNEENGYAVSWTTTQRISRHEKKLPAWLTTALAGAISAATAYLIAEAARKRNEE